MSVTAVVTPTWIGFLRGNRRQRDQDGANIGYGDTSV